LKKISFEEELDLMRFNLNLNEEKFNHKKEESAEEDEFLA
jgi:hypothetical protein